jgi:hypothetical protein
MLSVVETGECNACRRPALEGGIPMSKTIRRISITAMFVLLLSMLLDVCGRNDGVTRIAPSPDHSGTYCIDEQNIEITVRQSGNSATFTLSADKTTTGTGTVSGDTLTLTGNASDSDTLKAVLVFSGDGLRFSGAYTLVDSSGLASETVALEGTRGRCAVCDIFSNGIPKVATKDFTQLDKIRMISKFRSAAGHSYTDRFETCRSMKHYYSAKDGDRNNNVIEIYSPVNGTIVSVSNDGHGASVGLSNKQIRIKPESQPAFIFRIFHADLISSDVTKGKTVRAGDLIGHAHLYYEDLGEYADSFDIAVEANTPSGMRLVSYFDTMEDEVFTAYIGRGASSREDFIITREARDNDPLNCSGEAFAGEGSIANWVILN